MAFEPSGHRDLCIYDVFDEFCGQNSMDPLRSSALAPSDPNSSKDASRVRGFEAEVYVLRPYVVGFHRAAIVLLAALGRAVGTKKHVAYSPIISIALDGHGSLGLLGQLRTCWDLIPSSII